MTDVSADPWDEMMTVSPGEWLGKFHRLEPSVQLRLIADLLDDRMVAARCVMEGHDGWIEQLREARSRGVSP